MNGDALFCNRVWNNNHILQDGVRDCFSLNAQFILGRKQRKQLFHPGYTADIHTIRFLTLKINKYTLSFIALYPKLSKLPVNFV